MSNPLKEGTLMGGTGAVKKQTSSQKPTSPPPAPTPPPRGNTT